MTGTPIHGRRDKRQRLIGCLVGGAIGDGLGAPVEGTTGGMTIPTNTILDICRITHHNDEAYAGALAVTGRRRFGNHYH